MQTAEYRQTIDRNKRNKKPLYMQNNHFSQHETTFATKPYFNCIRNR